MCQRLRREAPDGPPGPAVQHLSADGAMVPVTGGEWAEVRAIALGTVEPDGEGVPHTTSANHRVGLRGLENRSRRPHRVTPPTWTTAEIQTMQSLREQYPYLEKAKLQMLLSRDGQQFSVSMVGRMLHRLR
jgi:hypothetical protein